MSKDSNLVINFSDKLIFIVTNNSDIFILIVTIISYNKKMRRTKHLALQREQLDRKFAELRSIPLHPPAHGWIRAIRESLGMSVAQLAKWLDVPRQNIHRIEQNELSGHVTVATLKKVADRLSCDLYVTLIPRSSLKTSIENRANEVAEKILNRIQLHMSLEDQKADEEFMKIKISTLAGELIRTADKRLWEDL